MKKFLVSILALFFIISMITTVNAATGSISIGASSDTVVKGKTFTVTIAGTADSPIDGMYTKFTYDKNVLSLESAAAGENYGNNSSEGEILVTNNSSTTSPTSATLYTITFKVLDNANVDSTTISFSESALHLNEGGTVKEVSSSIDNVIVKIKADDTIVGGGTETPDGNQNGEEKNPGNENQNPSNDDNSNDGSNNDNTNGGNNSGSEEKKENVNQNENEKIALSREQLLNKIWNYDYYGNDRTIDTHIKMLRNNLGEYRNLIKTVRGLGYKFEEE